MQYFTDLYFCTKQKLLIQSNVLFLASPALITFFVILTVALYIPYVKSNKFCEVCSF